MPIESILKKRQRMTHIVSHLQQEYPDSKCSLHYKSSFQLLVATILSAQCTPETSAVKIQEGKKYYDVVEEILRIPDR